MSFVSTNFAHIINFVGILFLFNNFKAIALTRVANKHVATFVSKMANIISQINQLIIFTTSNLLTPVSFLPFNEIQPFFLSENLKGSWI